MAWTDERIAQLLLSEFLYACGLGYLSDEQE